MENKCIVRLTTSYWNTKHGPKTSISLTYQKKLSSGYNILEEDISAVDIKYVMQSIINLYECNDGLYEVITTNVSTDYESALVDEYDLKLIPYKKD